MNFREKAVTVIKSIYDDGDVGPMGNFINEVSNINNNKYSFLQSAIQFYIGSTPTEKGYRLNQILHSQVLTACNHAKSFKKELSAKELDKSVVRKCELMYIAKMLAHKAVNNNLSVEHFTSNTLSVMDSPGHIMDNMKVIIKKRLGTDIGLSYNMLTDTMEVSVTYKDNEFKANIYVPQPMYYNTVYVEALLVFTLMEVNNVIKGQDKIEGMTSMAKCQLENFLNDMTNIS